MSESATKNTGYLFKNEKKNDRQPDYKGKVTVDGQEWSVSAWANQKDGKEYLSLVLTDQKTMQKYIKSENQSADVQGHTPEVAHRAPQSDGTPSVEVSDDFGDLFSSI